MLCPETPAQASRYRPTSLAIAAQARTRRTPAPRVGRHGRLQDLTLDSEVALLAAANSSGF